MGEPISPSPKLSAQPAVGRWVLLRHGYSLGRKAWAVRKISKRNGPRLILASPFRERDIVHVAAIANCYHDEATARAALWEILSGIEGIEKAQQIAREVIALFDRRFELDTSVYHSIDPKFEVEVA